MRALCTGQRALELFSDDLIRAAWSLGSHIGKEYGRYRDRYLPLFFISSLYSFSLNFA